MISSEDLVHLPHAPDLTEGGIAYVRQSLPRMYHRASRPESDRLPRLIAGVAVDLAFRRYLNGLGIPFQVRATMPFTDLDRFDLTFAGRRCELRSFLISHPQQIRDLAVQPALALQAPALVPLEQSTGDGKSSSDVYAFAFVGAQIGGDGNPQRDRSDYEARSFLIHVMPRDWIRPAVWAPMSPLVLKSESVDPISLEIGGQGAARDSLFCSVELQPGVSRTVTAPFHSITHVHSTSKPVARLGIRSEPLRETYIVQPDQWADIWLHIGDIFITGWIPWEEYRHRARAVPEGSRVFQFSRTRTKNLGMPMSDLRPIAELLEPARASARNPRIQL